MKGAPQLLLFGSGLLSLGRIASAAAAAASPVERVVTLLTELKARLETDETSEQQSYDKFACWCEETTSKQAATITDLRSGLKSLGNEILQLKGTVATRVAEIKELTHDIKENEAAQKTATAIRSKENTAYMAEEAELEQAIAALQKAATVLKSATASASLRQSRSDVEKWSTALAKLRSTISKISPHVQPAPEHVLALSKLDSKYTPQSATIQGILQDMYDSFSSTLQQLNGDESTKHRNYEDLMATYQKELGQLQATLAKKEEEKIAAETSLADNEVQYSETEKQLEADVALFDATKGKCEAKTEEWGERKSLRAEELAGITQALEILNSDESRELFGKAIKPGVGASFLQIERDAPAAAADSAATEAPEAAAERVLKKSARTAQSLRLASLAARVAAGGHFDEVITAIDELLQQLATEDKQDTQRVDDCKGHYQNLALEEQDLNWKIKNNDAKIEKLDVVIVEKENDKTEVVNRHTQVTNEIGWLTGNRTEENTLYLSEKSDDEKAIDLLQQAKEALETYYTKHKIGLGPLGNDFLQQRRETPSDEKEFAGTVPEAKFSDKGHRKGEAKGIMALLQNIIEDLQSELAGSRRSEAQAQVDYEKQLAAAEAVQKELDRARVSLEDEIATKKTEKTDEEEKKKANVNDLTANGQTRSDITPGCDFYIRNLDERTRKRGLERDGLNQAKSFLAGYRPPTSSMLQRKRRGTPGERSLDLDQLTFATVQ